ncbi:WGxxGxxG family protein [Paenibacillus sp. MBLB4367]|uniref:WGxxGxxG family protein n=1 Tax=Paenibacillus sp. MBLB4367 TaxID=3384767 RepID=UPI00390842E7
MKKLLSVMMIMALSLFLSLPAFAEGTTGTGMGAANTSTANPAGNTNAYGTGTTNFGNNTTRAYATNDNHMDWGWLGLLGLLGLAGLRNRSREREK